MCIYHQKLQRGMKKTGYQQEKIIFCCSAYTGPKVKRSTKHGAWVIWKKLTYSGRGNRNLNRERLLKRNFFMLEPTRILLSVAVVTGLWSASAFAETPPKYNANVPDEIITPNHVESQYLGEMNYIDGAPTEETFNKTRDFVDTANAVRFFLSGVPTASIQGLLTGHESIGMKPNQTIAVSEGNLTAESIWLTANTTTPYVTSEIDVKHSPVILEVGTPILGLIDNASFKFAGRIGVTHPQDLGKGGKYFIYHSSYKGQVPTGYIPIETEGYQHWLLLRIVGNMTEMQKNIQALKDTMKLYPYNKPEQKTEFINITGIKYNTVHAMNEEFYDEINTLIQYEPTALWNEEWLGIAKDLGIEKGKAFKPDARMQRIFKEASKIATAETRGANFYPSAEMKVYDNRQWFTPLIKGHEFKDKNGVISIDERTVFHFMATGITPDMVATQVGEGSAYLVGTRDSNGKLYDGSKHYIVTLPENIPAKLFWSFMIYDNQTRSMLETDQKSAGLDGLNKGLRINEDGTTTIHFSAKAPKGWESNWVQTNPEKGFNLLFRVYGPTEAWFDQTWRPSDLVDQK
jgi:hypothetical protein